jgi:hypothetical protein
MKLDQNSFKADFGYVNDSVHTVSTQSIMFLVFMIISAVLAISILVYLCLCSYK